MFLSRSVSCCVWLLYLLSLTTATAAASHGPEGVAPPGDRMQASELKTAADAPQIYEHSQEAGPDETLFLVGNRLGNEVSVWGTHAERPEGGPVSAKVLLATDRYLAFSIGDRAWDGPFVAAVKNAAGYSAPIVINAPQPWWCSPRHVAPGAEVRVFGRMLSRRPDSRRAFVYLENTQGKSGDWADVIRPGKYDLTVRVPNAMEPGAYRIWVHAGRGGDWGWGGPVELQVERSSGKLPATSSFTPKESTDLQQGIDSLAQKGGGKLKLPPGTISFLGTLRIPTGVTLQGSGRELTTIQLETSPAASLKPLVGPAWDAAPGAVHNVGDRMVYSWDATQDGSWTVWLRYGTDMAPWKLPGVSGHMTLQVDNQPEVPLENLPNTGGFGAFRWTKSAVLDAKAGKHKLTWKNVKGGGISLDAMVLAIDSNYIPKDTPMPQSGPGVSVIQGEDCTEFVTKDGRLPGGERAAVWLCGDGAAISDLTILGNGQVNVGIAIRSPQPTTWLRGCRVQGVRVADCEGKQGENCGVQVRYVDEATVRDNVLWARCPIYILGAKHSVFAENRLVSVTRFGGNAEAAIQGRNETIEECVLENNFVACPPGAESGGPTARRLVWLSTGHGSITRNWIAGNGVDWPLAPKADSGAGQARFGGVAGTDQNVGETILFEGNHRTAYFGPLDAADSQSVTLPKTIPPTPDDRLGNVKREQLAHDEQGQECPFWPPDADDGSQEPPIYEYYVTIFDGLGQGQTRRVVRREEQRLILDQPWRVAPQKGSVVAVGTAFYQNHIVGNHTPDGMTGIQLWISCIENVVAGNTIARQRKPGIFLYANGTTLASSMPRTWNRGVSPLFWNLIEGNRAEECSDGALVTSGDAATLPIDFPRALGNVLRHNSLIRSRASGVILTSRKAPSGVADTSASIVGTVVEFNVVRDAQTLYHVGQSADVVVLRRNQGYAWYPVGNPAERTKGIQIDPPEARTAIQDNNLEGPSGGALQ
jgi:hypothetical protein